ncbi:hypothetical protein nbrc107696_21540 [Gordonia spumicola]|uniref:Uncharacterized protein n=1 Tax=Gordonia spumicola TaxID=589161 RepID=A0A7I9V8J3_9ACTN|nr:hypothetical protein [Gordonia spumicola]GEE01708.1 hypothetical protein nbrc107696_21540 [Gordonia spumicola]
MATNETGGSLDDIANARAALQRTVTPLWMTALITVFGAAVFGFFTGSPASGYYGLASFVLLALFVGGVNAVQRGRSRPTPTPAKSPAWITVVATGATAGFIGVSLRDDQTHAGELSRYATTFTIGLAAMIGGVVLHHILMRNDSR